jgi:transposase-like protein
MTEKSQTTLPDEDACLDSLFKLNFAQLGACPGCQSTTARFYKLKSRKAYICQLCGHKIHPCANTFLHKSSTSLSKWLYAMYLLSVTRGSITTRELAERLQVTYKCAWRIRDRLRFATNGKFPVEFDKTDSDRPDFSALLGAFVFTALPDKNEGSA